MYKRGEAGEALVGTLHTLNITYANPQETLQGTPTVLGTSEPETPTFSYTVQASDLPTFDGVPVAYSLVAQVFASGKNTDAGNARTLCYRIKKNGTSISTATNLSVTANQYWTLNLRRSELINVVVGDVIEIYLWQITAGALNWDWQGFCVNLTRLQVSKKTRVLYNMTITISSTFPVFSLGSPAAASGGGIVFGVDSTETKLITISDTRIFNALMQGASYNLYRIGNGDNTASVAITNHAANHPNYGDNPKITQVTWYPTALGV